MSTIRENWRIGLLVILLLGSAVALLVPGAPPGTTADETAGSEAQLTNLQYGIELMADIGLVLVLGLSADLMNTYMLNVTLLRWYKYEGVNR